MTPNTTTDPEPESERDWIEYRVSLRHATFDTRLYLDVENARSSEAEALARERLAEAIRRGDVPLRWHTTARTRDDIHGSALMDKALACPRCNEVNMGEVREVRVDGEPMAVCLACVDALRAEDALEHL